MAKCGLPPLSGLLPPSSPGAEWTCLPPGLAWRMSMRKLHFLNDLSASVAREVTSSQGAGLHVATHPLGGVQKCSFENQPGWAQYERGIELLRHVPSRSSLTLPGKRCCIVPKSCLTLSQPHGLQLTRLFYLWDSLGKSTGVGCHFLLQGIFQTQGSNLHLLHWQANCLPLSHQGSPPGNGYGYHFTEDETEALWDSRKCLRLAKLNLSRRALRLLVRGSFESSLQLSEVLLWRPWAGLLNEGLRICVWTDAAQGHTWQMSENPTALLCLGIPTIWGPPPSLCHLLQDLTLISSALGSFLSHFSPLQDSLLLTRLQAPWGHDCPHSCLSAQIGSWQITYTYETFLKEWMDGWLLYNVKDTAFRNLSEKNNSSAHTHAVPQLHLDNISVN